MSLLCAYGRILVYSDSNPDFPQILHMRTAHSKVCSVSSLYSIWKALAVLGGKVRHKTVHMSGKICNSGYHAVTYDVFV